MHHHWLNCGIPGHLHDLHLTEFKWIRLFLYAMLSLSTECRATYAHLQMSWLDWLFCNLDCRAKWATKYVDPKSLILLALSSTAQPNEPPNT